MAGPVFPDRTIPVGQVWASPYCRAQETAELAFGEAEVIDGLERLYPTRDQEADARLNRMLREQAPAAGDPNLVIAGHGVYPSALTPAVMLAEGEAAVYALDRDEAELVGRLGPAEWSSLAVADQVLDSLVSVETRSGEQLGAGFRVALPGVVVTNAHIVAGVPDGTEVSVVLRDGTRRAAELLGRAAEVDIAALRVADDSGLPAMHSGSGLAEARPGDPVLAVGGTPALSAGALRALRQPVRLTGDTELAALQAEVAVDAGNTGAPLVNTAGEVLGVTTAVAEPVGTGGADAGFAIPVDLARQATFELAGR